MKTTIKTLTLSAVVLASASAQSAVLLSEDFESVNSPSDAGFAAWIANLNWGYGYGRPLNDNDYDTATIKNAAVTGSSDMLNVWYPSEDSGCFTQTACQLQTTVYNNISIGPENGPTKYTFTFDYSGSSESPVSSSTFGSIIAGIKVNGNSDPGQVWSDANMDIKVLNGNTSLQQGSVSITSDGNWGGSQIVPYIQTYYGNVDGGDYEAMAVWVDNVTVTSVPVPAAAWLMGSALLGLAGMKRSRK